MKLTSALDAYRRLRAAMLESFKAAVREGRSADWIEAFTAADIHALERIEGRRCKGGRDDAESALDSDALETKR